MPTSYHELATHGIATRGSEHLCSIERGTKGAHLGDVEQLVPEAGGRQGDAAGKGDARAIGKHNIAALQQRLLILLVNQQMRLDGDQRLGVVVSRHRCRLLRLRQLAACTCK